MIVLGGSKCETCFHNPNCLGFYSFAVGEFSGVIKWVENILNLYSRWYLVPGLFFELILSCTVGFTKMVMS